MGWADFGFQPVLSKCAFDARTKIRAIGFIVRMLELAATAFRKMAAWGFLVVWPEGERSVVEHSISRNAERYVTAICSDAIPSSGNPDD